MLSVEPSKVWEAYQRTGSVQRAGFEFGINGDTAWKVLRCNGYRLNRSKWSEEDEARLISYYKNTPFGEFSIDKIAAELRRSFSGIAQKSNELGCTIHSRPGCKKHYETPRIYTLEERKRRSENTKRWIQRDGHPRGNKGKKRKSLSTNKLQHACKTCSRGFSAHPSNKRKYCSLKCAYKDSTRLAGKNKKDRGCAVCPNCGDTFALQTNAGVKFCSQKCCGAFVGRATRNKNRPRPRDQSKWTSLICETCGKEFQRRKSNHVIGRQTFCTLICMANNPKLSIQKSLTRQKSKKRIHIYSGALRGWREIGGKRIFYKSRMEANYARYLTHLGILWEYEPETFVFKENRFGILTYTPDFRLSISGEYIECKGWMDQRSAARLKLTEEQYPSISLRLVDWETYRQIHVNFWKDVSDWEFDRHAMKGRK